MSDHHPETDAAADLMALDLECRLTIAHRIGCDCAPYFAQRREALLPEVLKEARRRGEDPVDVFAEFARKVHATKCSTFSAGRYAALMAMVFPPGACGVCGRQLNEVGTSRCYEAHGVLPTAPKEA